tara:strand:+ start:766 stop:1368 length:603 start_codon:yes stop_codon:yes gene_type:complete
MIINLQNHIEIITNRGSDINEHIPTIVKYGKECNHITEMGVRGICSTWGWLASNPTKLIVYDLENPNKWGGSLEDVYDTANNIGVDFQFIKADVLKVEIEETDLLFIDTLHVYNQLKAELMLHASKVRKYLCFHDTTNYEFRDEIPKEKQPDYSGVIDEVSDKKGLWGVIEEFLSENKDTWKVKERFINNNGFTILEKIK